ncbi:TetR/AcrR family transcriptional regulator [Arthrobacter sp.]|uniref:TetR/AcrR family transcriptional regulator n=1 Tax=Arthrobacter sp. TaxID=1667 RepID=UPI0028127560|nr:TetR/AcrR family transcriptional regulator [Arthrobacter sp.]
MLGNPTRDRLAERREASRREIVNAAWSIAREDGLAAVTLREVAARVGMRAPSLYTHFESRNAIFDAMFGQAWRDCVEHMNANLPSTDDLSLREFLKWNTRTFFEFCVSDIARFQLMNQRTIQGFEPSPESYAPSVQALERFREELEPYGLSRQEDIDLYTALLGGLIDAQLANDPGGNRWEKLLDRAVDMYVDGLDLPS